jgi:hypothetical protein
MTTLFRVHDGQPMYSCEGEVLYDGAGQPQFYIVDNNIVRRCSDGAQCYWVNGNYLFALGGQAAFYFDEAERAAELEAAGRETGAEEAATADETMIADLIIDGSFPEAMLERLDNAQKIRRIIERRRDRYASDTTATAVNLAATGADIIRRAGGVEPTGPLPAERSSFIGAVLRRLGFG